MKSPASLLACLALLAFAIWLTILVHHMPPEAAAARNGPPSHPSAAPAKQPCPVSLSDSHIVPANGLPNAGMQVRTVVTNTSPTDIASLSFLADHTDSYGVTREPNQSTLNVDRVIKAGESVPLNWEMPMDAPSVAHNKQPSSSDLQVYQVRFQDGRVESVSDLDDHCTFSF